MAKKKKGRLCRQESNPGPWLKGKGDGGLSGGQWQSTGSLRQRPRVQLQMSPPFFLSLCCFKGLQTVTAQIVFDYTISMGESSPSDSSCLILLVTLQIQQLHAAINTYLIITLLYLLNRKLLTVTQHAAGYWSM